MNLFLFLQAAIAFTIGIASLYAVYYVLNRYLSRNMGISEANSAFATLQVGVILSASMMISSIVGPGLNVIRFMNQNQFDFMNIIYSLGYVALFVFIGVLFTFLVIAAGIFIFFQLTRTNEWEEIKKNNISTAIISAALILGLALIMKDHVAGICEGLIPYPEVVGVK
jgi:uncharacterized membrane protein YjfL (UPF0719 family)